MDVGVSVDRGGVGAVASRVTSGMATQNRWGFRGSEDLGNGLSAFVVIEGGIRADSGLSTRNDTLFGRHTAVGLRGRHGALLLGLQDTPLFTTLNVVVDPLRNGIVRSNNLMSPTGFRAADSILYRSPELQLRAAEGVCRLRDQQGPQQRAAEQPVGLVRRRGGGGLHRQPRPAVGGIDSLGCQLAGGQPCTQGRSHRLRPGCTPDGAGLMAQARTGRPHTLVAVTQAVDHPRKRGGWLAAAPVVQGGARSW